MSDIIAGYFANEKDHKQLAHALQNAGFSHNNFTVYLDDDSERYLAVVQVRDAEEKDHAEKVFKNNHSTSVYHFENISGTLSYPDIKSLIESRAKVEVPDTPDLDIKTSSDGIDSEVKFGE